MISEVMSTNEIRVCMDVGSAEHYIAIGLASGERIQDIVLKHETREISKFFGRIEKIRQKYNLPVVFAMEGYNGHVRPIDKQILEKGYRLWGTDVYTEHKNLCIWNKSNGGLGSLYRSKHELVSVHKNGSGPHINNVALGRHGRNRKREHPEGD